MEEELIGVLRFFLFFYVNTCKRWRYRLDIKNNSDFSLSIIWNPTNKFDLIRL